MRLRRIVCAALVAALAAGSTQWTHAFYDDAHYSLTYFIARSCGYTPMQAWRVASATVSVDYSPLTEPEQRERVKDPGDTSHNARVNFHAMWDYRLNALGGNRSLAPVAISTRRAALALIGDSQRNPGALLHFVQDEGPHNGYSSWGGHWFPAASEERDPSMNLPFGATTDYLSFDQKKTMAMADDTTRILSGFMRRMAPRQRPGVACNSAALLPVLSALVGANPVSESAKVFKTMVEVRLHGVRNPSSVAPPSFATILTAAYGDESGPKVGKADEVVSAMLSELPQYRYKPFDERVRYIYDESGRTRQVDVMTLYGALTTTVRGGEPAGVGVSIWAAPTRPGGRPYQLTECKAGSTRFDNLPVGDLIVQSVADGKVTRSPFRLERAEQTYQINLAATRKETQANKCSNEAAAIAAKACDAARTDSDGALNQSRPAEDQLEQKLDECKQEEEKKNTEQENTPNTQTPSPVTPPPTGPSMGKILGWTALLTGSIVGGAYAYEQAQLLAEESYTTTPSTGNNSPVPPSSTPSNFTLGGFSCTAANSTSNLRTCTGSINIRAGSLMGARQGSSLGVLTNPSFLSGSFIAPATGGTTGTVTLRATVTGCPTQTAVSFLVTGGQPFETIAASIPMSCP